MSLLLLVKLQVNRYNFYELINKHFAFNFALSYHGFNLYITADAGKINVSFLGFLPNFTVDSANFVCRFYFLYWGTIPQTAIVLSFWLDLSSASTTHTQQPNCQPLSLQFWPYCMSWAYSMTIPCACVNNTSSNQLKVVPELHIQALRGKKIAVRSGCHLSCWQHISPHPNEMKWRPPNWFFLATPPKPRYGQIKKNNKDSSNHGTFCMSVYVNIFFILWYIFLCWVGSWYRYGTMCRC